MNVQQALRRDPVKRTVRGPCSCYQVKIEGVWRGGHRPSCPFYEGQQEAREHLSALKK